MTSLLMATPIPVVFNGDVRWWLMVFDDGFVSKGY
jgi:hypothetical protein